LIIEAENYLKSNTDLLKKTKILKWKTKQWGEIPADYGRK
jgi:ribonuclease HI